MSSGSSPHQAIARFAVGISAIALVGAHWWVFRGLLPTPNGLLGHDYSYYVPGLLNGYYWWLENGFFPAPWFTPAQCGGLPFYANPENLFYSAPQLLTLFVDPLRAVQANFVLFAAIGLVGGYGLLRGSFALQRSSALFGASLFLFNGYYAHRMLVGHLSFHSIMLVPLLLHLQLRPLPAEPRERLWRIALDSVLGGLCVAYVIFSANHDLLPMLLGIAGVAVIHSLRMGGTRWFLLRFGTTFALGALGSASKIAGATALLDLFPRTGYPVPGFDGVLSSLRVPLQSLFHGPAHEYAARHLVNNQWVMERPEFEYGLTFVPAVVLAAAAFAILWRYLAARRLPPPPDVPRLVLWCALLGVLALPLILNFHSPGFTALQKNLPILKHASNFIRWYAAYIPIVATAAAIALDLLRGPRLRVPAAVLAIGLVVLVNATTDRAHYAREAYDPRAILDAYERVALHRNPRPISELVDRPGLQSNDWFVLGQSSLGCYETLFGYRGEWFPENQLRPGPVMQEVDGRLNILNPACLLFPDANACRPGDRYPASKRETAEAFVDYRPVVFERPALQRVADASTGLALVGCIAVVLAYAARRLRS